MFTGIQTAGINKCS